MVVGPFKPSTSIASVKEYITKHWSHQSGWQNSEDLKQPSPAEQILFIRGKMTENGAKPDNSLRQ